MTTRTFRASRVKIEVTQDDIDRAIRNDSARCVAVQAIARTLKEASGVRVDTQTVRFRVGEERYQYLTPASCAAYVVDFDAGDKIEPFSFTLRDPRIVAVQHRDKIGKLVEAENIARRRGKPPRPLPDVDESEQPAETPSGYLSKAGHVTAVGRRPTRAVFGSNGRRVYGQRVLRYNRDRAQGYSVDQDGNMRVEPWVTAHDEGDL